MQQTLQQLSTCRNNTRPPQIRLPQREYFSIVETVIWWKMLFWDPKKKVLSKIMSVMDLNSRKDISIYGQCSPQNLSKQCFDQSVMCAHLTKTQLDKLTESSEKIKVFAQTANHAKECFLTPFSTKRLQSSETLSSHHYLTSTSNGKLDFGNTFIIPQKWKVLLIFHIMTS